MPAVSVRGGSPSSRGGRRGGGSRPASPAGRRPVAGGEMGGAGGGVAGRSGGGMSWAARLASRRRGTATHPKTDQLGGAPARASLTLSPGGWRGPFSTPPNSPVHGGPFFDTLKTRQLVGAPARPTPFRGPSGPDGRPLWWPWASRAGGASGGTRGPRRRSTVGVDRRTRYISLKMGGVSERDHTPMVHTKDIF